MMYLAYSLLTLHMFVGIFLIGLILLQRGRGGGLAGSFGGMGGQSAFGTKAGDIFTKITIAVAIFWIVLACVCILVVNAAAKNGGRAKFTKEDGDKAVITAPADDKADAVDTKQGEPVNGEKKSETGGETKGDADTAKDSGVVKEGNGSEAKPPVSKEAPVEPVKPVVPEAKEAVPPKAEGQDNPAKPESSDAKKSE